MKLLAALILTAAALATPSASAHFAAFIDGIHWGFAVDATTAMAAEEQAEAECERKAQSGDCVIINFRGTTTNRCVAAIFTNDGGITPQANTTVAIVIASPPNDSTRTGARETGDDNFGHLNDITGFHFSLIDLSFNRDVCDNTCSGNTIPPQHENEIGGCEPVKSNSDCETVAARDGNQNVYVDTNTNGETICREELLCEEGNRIPNGSGGCTICEANQMANDMNNDCIPIVPLEVEVPVPVTVTNNMEVTVTNNMEVTVTNNMGVTVTNNTETTVTNNSGNPITTTNTITETHDREKTAALAAGVGVGVGAIVLGLYYFINKKPGIIVYEPSYSFRNNNGILSYSVGNRWTATTDNWRFYWQAKQNDKFVYGSGIGYNNGLLSAAINSQSEKDKTNLDVQLSANKTVGLWNIGGGINFDMQLSDDATETQNRLNAKIRYTVDKWILSANANTDGKKSAARINYSYRF